jgi:hypothetical protein
MRSNDRRKITHSKTQKTILRMLEMFENSSSQEKRSKGVKFCRRFSLFSTRVNISTDFLSPAYFLNLPCQEIIINFAVPPSLSTPRNETTKQSPAENVSKGVTSITHILSDKERVPHQVGSYRHEGNLIFPPLSASTPAFTLNQAYFRFKGKFRE